jgi:hypothetical protein
MTDKVELSCAQNSVDPKRPYILVRLHNRTPETIHIFNSPRLPYFILQEDGSLLLLFGVHPPDPEIDYGMIEIPITRPLFPGETACWQVSLTLVVLRDHYEAALEPAGLLGSIRVVVQAGWGATPITPEQRHQTNIYELLAWQKLVSCQMGEVTFP